MGQQGRGLVVLDTSTGEFLEGYRITAPGQQEWLQGHKKLFERQAARVEDHAPLGRFVLTKQGDQFASLTPQSAVRLALIGTYLVYGRSGRLALKRGVGMRRSDLPDVLKVDPSTAWRFWQEVEGRYLEEDADGALVLRDGFFKNGAGHQKERLTKVFIDGVRLLYANTPPRKHRTLGYIFQLLDHVNTEFNILAWNTETTVEEEVEPMTWREFCGLVGYDISQSRRLARELSSFGFVKDGQFRHLFAFVTRRIIVNPRIIYGGEHYKKVEAAGMYFMDGCIPPGFLR